MTYKCFEENIATIIYSNCQEQCDQSPYISLVSYLLGGGNSRVSIIRSKLVLLFNCDIFSWLNNVFSKVLYFIISLDKHSELLFFSINVEQENRKRANLFEHAINCCLEVLF